MRLKLVSFFLIFSPYVFAFTENNFSKQKQEKTSLNVQYLWSVDMDKTKPLVASLMHNSPTLLTDQLVIQGNGINGIKAFSKQKGHLVWSFPISSGVFSPLEKYKGRLYFGASDGFFYSLDLKTGELIWKFFTGSENLGPALIHNNRIYWTASNQKLYALSLEGSLFWVYAGTPLTRDIILRGRPRPSIYKKIIYMGFYDGTIVALDKKNGKLKWKRTLSATQSIYGDLFVRHSCLLVSVFKANLFCLNLWNGRVKWKTKGDAFIFPRGSLFYQISNNNIQAIKKVNRKKIWSVNLKSYPMLPSIYKNYLIYGSLLDNRIYVAHKLTGQLLTNFKFGKGLAAPVTVDQKTGDLYFVSVDAYLHKVRLF